MTDPIELTVRGKDEVIAFACGKCHIVASSPKQYVGDDAVEQARESARLHCGPWLCACGAGRDRYASKCRACRDVEADTRSAEQTAAALAKAKRVAIDAYDVAMVYDDDASEYLWVDTLRDRIADGDAPSHVFGCTEVRFRLDAEDVITSELESGDHHEGAGEWLEKGATEALQKALDEWAKEYAGSVVSYVPDYSVVIWLGEEER